MNAEKKIKALRKLLSDYDQEVKELKGKPFHEVTNEQIKINVDGYTRDLVQAFREILSNP